MRVAYADPPYVGQAKRHYGSDEVDHKELIWATLAEYDAWALSCSSPSLQYLLDLCPEGVRVMAWVKPFASFKPNVNPAYAWEPVIVMGGRKRTRDELTVRDWTSANITLQKGLHGVKPWAFCVWLFEVLNLRPEDEFDDLFPGSGAVTRAWEQWQRSMRMTA
jgi:hypothetical protein